MKHAGSHARIAAVALLAVAVLSPLVFPTDVEALDIGIFNPPSGLLDAPYNFVVTASPGMTEGLAISGASVSIYKDGERSRYEATLPGLPVVTSVKPYPPAPYVGRPATAIASVTRAYAYYSISWTAPTDFPQGRYRIEATVISPAGTLTRTSGTFVLYIVSPGRPTDILNIIDDAGVFKASAAIQSPDASLTIVVLQGTRVLTDTATRVTEMSVTPVTTLPPAPTGGTIMGDVYEVAPSRATFSTPAPLSITYHPARIPAGFTERNLVIAYYDLTRDAWVMLPDSVFDPATLTVTAPVTRFAPYALMAYKFPASFTVSSFVIDPQRVTSGDSTNVTVTVTNRGDFRGSYDVVLTVDDDRYASLPVTLDGRVSENVTFSINKTALGTHTVRVGGLNGSFTVIRAPPPTRTPPPPAPPSTQPPAPKPAPTTKPAPPAFKPTPIPIAPPPPTVSEWVVFAWFMGIVVFSLAIWWIIRARRIT